MPGVSLELHSIPNWELTTFVTLTARGDLVCTPDSIDVVGAKEPGCGRNCILGQGEHGTQKFHNERPRCWRTQQLFVLSVFSVDFAEGAENAGGAVVATSGSKYSRKVLDWWLSSRSVRRLTFCKVFQFCHTTCGVFADGLWYGFHAICWSGHPWQGRGNDVFYDCHTRGRCDVGDVYLEFFDFCLLFAVQCPATDAFVWWKEGRKEIRRRKRSSNFNYVCFENS